MKTVNKLQNSPDSTEVKTVVVLGMHRSGTSVVTAILQQLGVDVGTKLLGPLSSNPLGHFENIEFIESDDKILNLIGASWDQPVELKKIQKAIRNKSVLNEISSICKKVVKRNEKTLWGWKVPTTTITIDFYMPYLKKPYFIICHRNSDAIVKSFKCRDGMDERKIASLINAYEIKLKAFKKEYHTKIMEIEYEHLLKSPEPIISAISDFLGLSESKDNAKKALSVIMGKEQLRKLKADTKKKEIFYILKAILLNPHLFKRYFFKLIQNPKYILVKMGIIKASI